MEHLKGKVTPFKQMYYKWRALRTVPFRKRFFVGYDLDGNTYWEFFNPNNPFRPRRIVDYRIPNKNWVDYKMPPQWMQWLRFARPNYPSLEELADDVKRQEILKLRVQQAEARWKSVPLKEDQSAQTSSLERLLETHKQKEQETPVDEAQVKQQLREQQDQQAATQQETPAAADMKLKHQQATPSQNFQPEGWTPVSRR